MSISSFITNLVMVIFLVRSGVGIIGSVAFLLGLAIILSAIDSKQKKNEI